MYNYNENEIIQKIYQVMNILNINRMPTSKEVRMTQVVGLDPAISRTGGYKYWAEKLNLSPKITTTKWNDKMIKDNILKIINILDIDRMPSRSEIKSTEGDDRLHNAIVRSGGYYKWANILGLEIKESETSLGVFYQNYCKQQLEEKGYIISNTTMKAPYDLLVNNNIRIDVKSGCAYNLCTSRVHTFGINKQHPSCDIYIVYALDEEAKKIERTFIIPSKDLKVVSLCIGKHSKYNKYINRWDYIDLYDTFYKSLAN